MAAVAVPQYQVALGKSRYATLKNLADSIAKAQEIYYLTNGTYTRDFDTLDIELPKGTSSNNNRRYSYNWGYCQINLDESGDRISCNYKENLVYAVYFQHSTINPGLRRCTVRDIEDLNNWRYMVCRQETGKTTKETEHYAY